MNEKTLTDSDYLKRIEMNTRVIKWLIVIQFAAGVQAALIMLYLL